METFTWIPQYEWDDSREHYVAITEFESSKEQRLYRGTGPRAWRLSFVGTLSEIDEIAAFFDARKASYEAFLWTPPGESTAITVRFKDNKLTRKNLNIYYTACELSLQEVLE